MYTLLSLIYNITEESLNSKLCHSHLFSCNAAQRHKLCLRLCVSIYTFYFSLKKKVNVAHLCPTYTYKPPKCRDARNFYVRI